jgi:hypothetical protein
MYFAFVVIYKIVFLHCILWNLILSICSPVTVLKHIKYFFWWRKIYWDIYKNWKVQNKNWNVQYENWEKLLLPNTILLHSCLYNHVLKLFSKLFCMTKTTNVYDFMIIYGRISTSSVIGLYYNFQSNILVFTTILLILRYFWETFTHKVQ